MALGFSNPIAPTTQSAMGKAQVNLTKAAVEIGTGQKSSLDNPLDRIVGTSLLREYKTLTSIAKVVSYAMNLTEVAANQIESLDNILMKQQEILNQISTQSPTQQKQLYDAFKELTVAATRVSKNAEFNNRKLLTGDLGGQSTVKNAFDTVAVQHKSDPGALANVFAARGATANSTIQMTGVPTAGHDVTINGITFEWIANAANPTTDYQVRVGTTTAEAAQNLAYAIENAPDLALKSFTTNISVAGTVRIDNVSNTDATIIPVSGSDGAGGAVANITIANNASAATPITISGVTQEAFIGTITPTFTTIQVETAADADALAVTYGYAAGAAHANNRTAEFKCTIGTGTEAMTYKGAIYMTNAAGNINGAKLKMTSDTGSTFTINFDAAYAGSIAAVVNADAVAAQVNTLFAGSTFSQTRYVTIDTSGGNITSGGTVVGTTDGLVASLNTTDFEDLTFEDFTITDNAGAADFSAKIGGKTFVNNGVAVNTLVKGERVDLTHAASGDVFSLYLGENGLTAMTTAARMTEVQDAFKSALGVGKGLKIRAGSDFTDTIDLKVDNLTAKSLYVDNAGTYQATMDITTPAGLAKAEEVINNALDKIGSAIAKLGSQMSNLELTADAIDKSRLAQKNASDRYLKPSYEESTAKYTEALNQINAGISIIIKSGDIARAVSKMIDNA